MIARNYVSSRHIRDLESERIEIHARKRRYRLIPRGSAVLTTVIRLADSVIYESRGENAVRVKNRL